MTFLGNTFMCRGIRLARTLLVGALAIPAIQAFGLGSPIVNTGWNSQTATSLQSAGRLLNQASFGPTANDMFNVENIGLSAYIDQQFAVPAYQMPAANRAPVSPGDCGSFECPNEYYWWNDILFGQDQLRQRVAFELSKLFVVSVPSVDPRYMPYFLNTLSRDAFGNWYTLMRDVSLSSAMGWYLNMGNSFAPGPGQRANENFARELMQLFSIGATALNQDGTPKLDANGNPVPNYTQDVVQNFALAYTGWTFATNDVCGVPPIPYGYWYPDPPGQNCPMIPFPGKHSTVAKTLLRGTVLPAGQSAQQDFDAALQNIFNDPSLPPFVCRRLIQSLVRSNPSPAYISRVAGVFINNGAGVRGDMKAVIKAVLLDPEARAADSLTASDANGGKLRDPILWWTSIMRALGAKSGAVFPYVNIYESRFDLWLSNLDETPHAAPSVFSYYSPDYQLSNGLYGPEFENENVETLAWAVLHLEDVLHNNFGVPASGSNEFSFDLGPSSMWYQAAVQQGPTQFVNTLSALLLHGTMTQDMQQAIVTAIQNQDTATMVRMAVYLIVTSPQYKVML